MQRPLMSVAVVGVMATWSSTSRAAEPTWHTTAEVTTSYSDNILAAPDVPPPVDPPIGPPTADLMMQFAPGVAVFYEDARTRLLATYAHPFIFFARHPAADTSADVLHGEAELLPTELDVVELKLDVGRYTTNVSTLQASSETAISAARGSSSTMFALGLSEEWRHELGRGWSWMQTASAGLGIPLAGGTSLFTGSVTTGPRLFLTDHAFALLPSFTYAAPLTDEPAESVGFQTGSQVIVGGRGQWHWVFSEPEWSLTASAGALAALEGGETEVEPVGGAGLRFQKEGYGVSLSYDRGYMPNVLTGQTFFSDRVGIRGDLPIVPKHDIRASTGSGFALNRMVDVPRELDIDRIKTIIVDAAVGWYPSLYPHIELRYQHTEQWDAPTDQIVAPNFTRNVFSVSVRYMWPPIELTLPKGHHQKPEETNPLEAAIGGS